MIHLPNGKLRAAFDNKTPKHFIDTGPFAYIRHPVYTAYLLIWCGWAIRTFSMWSLAPITLIFVSFVLEAVEEENAFRLKIFLDYQTHM